MTEPEVEEIRERLLAVQRRIASAGERAGRDPDAVNLVVITKGHPAESVQALLDCGVRRLGENRVEEAVPKIEALGPHAGLTWHLVGPLQSRKVRLVGDLFALIHSVDRLKTAQLLDAQASALGRRQAVLLEWNVSGEAAKAGWRLEDGEPSKAALEDVRQIAGLPHLLVRGLMTVGPLTSDMELQRRTFRRLADLGRRLRQELALELPELSMGMTDDFEAAVAEGATLLRIGRAILGERM
jgi:pyridoxal phosphate enzyme (YggS family)